MTLFRAGSRSTPSYPRFPHDVLLYPWRRNLESIEVLWCGALCLQLIQRLFTISAIESGRGRPPNAIILLQVARLWVARALAGSYVALHASSRVGPCEWSFPIKEVWATVATTPQTVLHLPYVPNSH